MLCTGLYFLIAYTVVAILIGCRWRSIKQGSWPHFYVALLLTLPFWPYGLIGVQTALLGPALRDDVIQAMKDTAMMTSCPDAFRVMSLSPSRVAVYVTQKQLDGKTGDLIRLRRSGGKWVLADWDCVWSSSGSADGNTFPPFPEGM